jgi:hypothetical protein
VSPGAAPRPSRRASRSVTSIRRVNFWLLVGGFLAVVAVVVVALPFLRRPGLSVGEDRLEEGVDRARVQLAEERDRALAALKELEFDHRTGKVSDDDYRELVGPMRRRAAEALHALDPPRPGEKLVRVRD